MPTKIPSLAQCKDFSKRLISQMTKRDLKLSNPLSQYLDRFGFGKRKISQTPVRKGEMVDPMELATGIEKRELVLIEAGCDDPWAMGRALKRASGKADDPTQIPSAFEGRLVGCACLGDRFVKWMWLEKGEAKRCECGHFFKLKYMPPV